MNFLKTFFGQILRKNDYDYTSQGSRDVNVQTHIDLSNKKGGVVQGLDVFKSSDGLSILVTPGIFYSKGVFSSTNSLGGGERARIYSTQTFEFLPRTPPIGNEPSYLLVYAKTVSQNIDPDPTKSQTVITSKNVQTGENIPIREYTAGSIVVSNPILYSEISNINGVPLAVFQVGYDGTSEFSSSNVAGTIDVSVKSNYTVAGVLDLSTQKIVESAIEDNFITTRMMGDDQVTGDKFSDNSIFSSKIAQWDTITSGNDITGSGIATQHLKDEAVTSDKINYSGSMNNFSTRNMLSNSAFEKNVSFPVTDWVALSGTGISNNIEINSDSDYVKYGFKSLKLTGGFDTTAKRVGVYQTLDFKDNIKDEPFSAFVSVKPLNGFNLATSGTTGIKGTLDFISSSDSIVKSVTFDAYSGSSTDWRLLASSEPIIPEVDARSIRFTVEGNFDNTVYIDTAFLGKTDKIPSWDLSMVEQVIFDGLDASIIKTGQFSSDRIATGSIQTKHIRNEDGSSVEYTGSGILTGQLRSGCVTTDKLADKSVTTEKLDPSVLAIPKGAIIMWDGFQVDSDCPSGWSDITTKFAGRFPIGFSQNTSSSLQELGRASLAEAIGDPLYGGRLGSTVKNISDGSHSHTMSSGRADGGLGPFAPDNGWTNPAGAHTHEVVVPYRIVKFCQKD